MMRFTSDDQRQAIMAKLRRGGGSLHRQSRKSKVTRPMLSIPQIQAEMQRYEGRTLPPTLLKQLNQQGSALLRKAGYTTGLAGALTPSFKGHLAGTQARDVVKFGRDLGAITTRSTPITGVALRRDVMERRTEQRRRAVRALAKAGLVASAFAAPAAGLYLTKTAAGRQLAARAVRGVHPLRPMRKILNDVGTISTHNLEQRVHNATSIIRRGVNKKIDSGFDRLVGTGEVPGLIDRIDQRFLRRPLRKLAMKAGLPVLTQTGEVPATLARSGSGLWNEMLRGNIARGRVTRGKKTFFVELKKLPGGQVRRRKVRV